MTKKIICNTCNQDLGTWEKDTFTSDDDSQALLMFDCDSNDQSCALIELLPNQVIPQDQTTQAKPSLLQSISNFFFPPSDQ